MGGNKPICTNRGQAGLHRTYLSGWQGVKVLVVQKTSGLGFSGKIYFMRVSLRALIRYAGLFSIILLNTCSSSPPTNIGDVCSIFEERAGWFRAARASEKRWQTPIAVTMAIIYQESSFRSRARPERKRFLWFFPGARPSSAFGYAQALDSTWEEYQQRSGNASASRSDFSNAVDFVAWYVSNARRVSGIGASDVRALYYAYHEGNAGFQRGTYLSKRWLMQAADQVQKNSEKFGRQLGECRADLAKSWFEKPPTTVSDKTVFKPVTRSFS